MPNMMLSVWEQDDERDHNGIKAHTQWKRWADTVTPAVTIQETEVCSGQYLVVWGNSDAPNNAIWHDGVPRRRTWNVPNFSSVEDAKKAVDTRLRQLGYVLPEDEADQKQQQRMASWDALAEHSTSAGLLVQLDTQRAHIKQLSQSLREAESGWRGEKDWRLRLEEELKDRTKERDALLEGSWAGAWAPEAAAAMARLNPPGNVSEPRLRAVVMFDRAEKQWVGAGKGLHVRGTRGESMTQVMALVDQALLCVTPRTTYLVGGRYEAPTPSYIWCPACETTHIDEGELAWKPHRTHECAKCGHKFPAGGPGEFYVGVDPKGRTL